MSTQERFNQWLDKIIQEEHPSEKVIAYNFGVFETPSAYCLYLIGSERYDEFDDDWACRQDFVPKEKHFELYAIDSKSGQWPAVLEKVIELVKNYMKTAMFKDSFLDKCNVITAGYDSGDIVKIKSK